jgi:hypothetical protein
VGAAVALETAVAGAAVALGAEVAVVWQPAATRMTVNITQRSKKREWECITPPLKNHEPTGENQLRV